MTRTRDPFQTALTTLRDLTTSGVFQPGRPIVIVEEARRLGLSTTPVREALAWLCGEGLIERGPSGGYLAPRLNAGVVKDRFLFRLQCLMTSLDLVLRLRDRLDVKIDGVVCEGILADQFTCVVRSGGNSVTVDAFDRVGRQLLVLKNAERKVFSDADAEESALSDMLRGEYSEKLRKSLVEFHQRRVEAAGLLVLQIDDEIDRQIGRNP